ncbi:MAG: radical SAM family heme chaperone HemW, partial [Psittacicella sp.]
MNLNKTLPPLSVYIHIPWCVHKCPYCDFNSHEIKGSIDEDAYTNHLIQDFKNDAKYIQGREIQTIFIGGGTPNSLKASSIGKILDFIKDNYKVSKDLEVTMEANPGAFNTEYFQEYVDNGVNRISIGVQSFQSNKLAFLERIHSKDDAIKVIKHLKTIKNLKSFNIDLMYGLKDQTLEDMQSDLKTAISLEPDHISWYQLTIEPNTRFFHDVPKNLPDDDYLYELSQSGLSILEEAGYKRYEISAYGKSKDVRCLHNLNYWKFGD